MTDIDVAVLAQRLADGELKIDEEAGDLHEHGRHVLRAGKIVSVSTWGPATATEYDTEDEARKAFREAAP